MKKISDEELRTWATDYANANGGAYFGEAYKHFMAGMKHIISKFVPDVSDKDRQKYEDLLTSLQQQVFHMTNDETKMVVDEFLKSYPIMLEFHEREWYYKYM